MNTKYKDDNAAIDNHTDLSLIGKKFRRYINQPVKKKVHNERTHKTVDKYGSYKELGHIDIYLLFLDLNTNFKLFIKK